MNAFSRFLSQYGMVFVLLLLCVFFSLATLREQHPTGADAARALEGQLIEATRAGAPGADAAVVIVSRAGEADVRFARELARRLAAGGHPAACVVSGDPAAVRQALEPFAGGGAEGTAEQSARPAARLIVATLETDAPVVRSVLAEFPTLAQAQVLTPPSYRWPTFLLPDNLLNVANQIAVIAILAIGMTMVIITGGIDLSVGSLIALAAVVTTGLIGQMGGEAATGGAMVAAGLAAIVMCGLIGSFSGFMITRFGVPPFIATLGMMQVASGLAYILSQGKPIYRVPEALVTLGRGTDPLLGLPYAVLLMALLYLIAHLLMSRTTLGRYIYAVGGNAEASRLAGVRVKGVLLFVYAVCGMLAGLGGVVMASQLKSGAPTYGLMYELYVIAAVVVGGTSLSGGEGRILGTLIGAFIIAVIQNGMNLTNVESYTQKVVLGLVILGAVLLDRLKHRGLGRRRAR
jgi:ribose transport system permease protein